MNSDTAQPQAEAAGGPPLGWQGIRDVMMDRIRTRHYAPGALIPNETDLAAEFGFNPLHRRYFEGKPC